MWTGESGLEAPRVPTEKYGSQVPPSRARWGRGSHSAPPWGPRPVSGLQLRVREGVGPLSAEAGLTLVQSSPNHTTHFTEKDTEAQGEGQASPVTPMGSQRAFPAA